MTIEEIELRWESALTAAERAVTHALDFGVLTRLAAAEKRVKIAEEREGLLPATVSAR